MLIKKANTLIALVSLALSITLFTGCAGQATSAEGENALSETGTIILRVNPEISIQYNKDGLVTKLEGLNADGDDIVDDYDDYIGKDARAVVKELVEDINEAGYFVSEIDGSTRSITIQIEPGSVLPQSDYMNVLASDVQAAVQSMQLNSHIVGIGPEDYDGGTDYGDRSGTNHSAPASATQYITEAKAKEIALSRAGLTESEVTFVKVKRDWDNGRMEYEVEFYKGSVEYDYEIDALTGKILEADSEIDDSGYRAQHRPGSSASSAPVTSQLISKDKAIEIALAHAGVKKADARFEDRELDLDDGRALYEIDFTAGGIEYEYDIDAGTGKILRYERDEKNASRPASSPPASKPGQTSRPSSGRADDSGYTNYSSDDSGYTNYSSDDSGYTNYSSDDSGYTNYSSDDSGYTNYDHGDSGYSSYGNGDSGYSDYD